MRQLVELTLPSAAEHLPRPRPTCSTRSKPSIAPSNCSTTGSGPAASLDDARRRTSTSREPRSAPRNFRSIRPTSRRQRLRDGGDAAQPGARQPRHRHVPAGYATIAAPRDGVLISRNVERGNVVQPGKALLVLAPAGETQLVLQIDERNLGKLALGPAGAGLGRRVPRPAVRRRRQLHQSRHRHHARHGRGEARVPEPPAYLRQDMTVSVDIEVGAPRSALVAAGARVHDCLRARPGSWACATAAPQAAGHARPARQRTSKSSSGCGGGRPARIPGTAGVLTGQRVRPVRP